MKIKKATARYESWLGEQTPLIQADLDLKHAQMAAGLFPFLRATYYRWAQLYPVVCPDLAQAPRLLAVGDLHVENFGTWRDIEGRLIWGIDDFDEAYPLPYTNDLVRLAVSAELAIQEGHLRLSAEEACTAILAGYGESLQAAGRPFVLAETHEALRKIAVSDLRDPVEFWSRLEAEPAATGPVAPRALRTLERLMPESGLSYRIVHRVAGMGSLGRARWVALADWRGGKVAREVKSLAPSAYVWAAGADDEIYYPAILERAVRCPDPLIAVRRNWLARRLAPDCSRIELSQLPRERDESRLLHAMGWETANVHLGSRKAIRDVWRDLQKRPAGWLHAAAHAMSRALAQDWQDWKRSDEETGKQEDAR